MAIDLLTLSTEQLKRAIEIKEKIDALQAELNHIEGGESAPTPSTTPSTPDRKKGKRYVSPEARQKMAVAQRARWAAKRKGNGAPEQVEAGAKPKAKGKRVMTEEWRAKIAAAQKNRWAKQRGETAPAKADEPVGKPAGQHKIVSPKKLAALAKARAARWAKAKAAK